MKRLSAPLLAGWMGLNALPGCQRPAPQPSRPADAAAAQQVVAQGMSGRWLLRRVEVEAAVAADQRATGVDELTLRAALLRTLREAPQIAGLALEASATRPAGIAPGEQAALYVRASWQRLDADARVIALDSTADGSLAVEVLAHAEAPSPDGRENAIAERRVNLSLPLGGGPRDWSAWLLPRLERAALLAVGDALGELWSRQASDAHLQQALQATDMWRLVAAVREVGERRQVQHTARLEALAADSRKDVAVVALAALGRLGQSRSVSVLVAQAGRSNLEVADAALVALAALDDEGARAALDQIAADHPVSVVRHRAAALRQLQSQRDARP